MRRAPAGLMVLAIALAGCGGDGPTIKVAAASSLTGAFTECGSGAQLEFGGSDDLAAQIRQGVGIDVFAAATLTVGSWLPPHPARATANAVTAAATALTAAPRPSRSSP